LPVKKVCAKNVVTANRQIGDLKVGISFLGGKGSGAIGVRAIVGNIWTGKRDAVIGVEEVLVTVSVVLEIGVEGMNV
jgi:hypothetical protein